MLNKDKIDDLLLKLEAVKTKEEAENKQYIETHKFPSEITTEEDLQEKSEQQYKIAKLDQEVQALKLANKDHQNDIDARTFLTGTLFNSF